MAEPTPKHIDSALGRWLDALNTRGDRSAVEAAMTPDGRVERYGFGETRDDRLDLFEGIDAIVQWLSRSPAGVRFSLADRPQPAGDGWHARYRIEVEDFANEGTWWVRLGEDGRIELLTHHPDALTT